MTAVMSALFASAAACSSTDHSIRGFEEPPRNAFAYPSQAYSGPVTVQARFYTNHEEIFGDDLIDEYGLVPIALRIGLDREDAMGRAKIFPADMKLRLYLQDGSVLSAVDALQATEDDEEVHNRVRDESLKADLLVPFERSSEGMVYFRADAPDALTWTDATVASSTARKLRRTIDLAHSLCAFEVTIGLEQVSLFVGLDVRSRSQPR